MPSPVRERRIIERAARSQRIPPALLWGVYGAETNFGRNVAVSSAGAQGPFQFMPDTARGLGINPHNFRQAAFGAARYLAPYFRKYGERGALIAYNAGPGRIGGDLPAETRAYIPKVLELAKTWKGAPGGGGGGADPAALLAAAGGPQAGSQLPQGGEGALALLQALSGQQRQQPSTSAGALPTPGFAAGPRLAGQVPMSSGGPAPKVDVGALMAAVRTLGGDVPSAAAAGGQQPGGQPQGAGGGPRGKVIVAPTANRAGVPLQREVVRFVRGIAGRVGSPLTIGTGSNHSRLTVNGNVSDHWDGYGADVPLAGSALIRAGRAALIEAGMSPRRARRIRGGLFNVGGWQIIFNTDQGGDHTDHLHVGRRH